MARVDRIQLFYDLTFQTPFHCGTGLRSGLIDRAIVRDSEGYLYVPGSSIKGALRMHCEALARLYEEREQEKDRIDSPHDGKKALWNMGNPATLITRIFGSQQQPGHLFFDDARQDEKEKQQYDSRERGGKRKYQSLQSGLYTQVRLDRPTRTAVAGALFTSEFGVKDFTFKGSIVGWLECLPVEEIADKPTYSLLLLLAGLHMLERLGGNRSTGKGRCRCDVTSLHINGKLYPETQWQPWLDQLDALSFYSEVAASQQEEQE